LAHAPPAAAVAGCRGAAAVEGRTQAQAARAQVARWHAADRAVWRPATQAGWWRGAGPEDIGRAWRAATVWQSVDPDAAEAHRFMGRQLAERGVQVEAERLNAGDVAWLRTALAGAATDRRQGRPGRDRGPARLAHTDADRERMAGTVRQSWGAERAAAVLASAAWPAMVYRMHEHQQAGGDLETLLEAIDLTGARDPAALAEWQIEQATIRLSEPVGQREEPAGGRGEPARGTETGAAAQEARAAARGYPVATRDAVAARRPGAAPAKSRPAAVREAGDRQGETR
jgi:hypothetical protein